MNYKGLRRLALGLTLALVLGRLPAGAAPSTAALETHPCNVPPVGSVVCGLFAVHEDRSSESGRLIGIRFLRYPAQKAGGDPVFFLAGGPGQASQPLVGMPGPLLRSLHRNHDLVFIDQRGTGASNPLRCHLFTSTQSYFLGSFPADNLRACRKELAAEADLNDYGTSNAADESGCITATFPTTCAPVCLRFTKCFPRR